MGIIDDYVASLEGQEITDPSEVVAELVRLHNQEISTSTAKIGQLETQLSDKDVAIAERDSTIRDTKAANWDLVNRLPGTSEKPEPTINEDTGLPDSSSITLDDMFAQ
jgi:hypothetical protein